MKAYGLIVFLVSMLLVSCQKEEGDYSTERIKSDILVSLDTVKGEAHLVLETEEIYSCINYTINYSEHKVAGKTLIKLGRVLKPGLCFRATGPAKAISPLRDNGKGDTLGFSILFKRKSYSGWAYNGEIGLENPGKVKLK